MTTDLTPAQQKTLECLPNPSPVVADELDLSTDAAYQRLARLRDNGVVEQDDNGVWMEVESVQHEGPDVDDLSDKERILLHELQTAATPEELAEELGLIPPAVHAYLSELENKGWEIYHDETANLFEIEGDHSLRSSEHKGTRTRKANRWWETRHNALEREWKRLEQPSVDPDTTPEGETWVTHLTDLHAGDIVRGYDDEIVHTTDHLLPLVDYITDRSLHLAEVHGADYDSADILWGGDFVTNSGIYQGQFENLDKWLDEQIDVLHDPLLRQIKRFADQFDSVRIVCQAGNHGEIRANGSSKQANADLILYKSIRNTVSALQDLGYLENVGMKIGRAGSPTPFRLRGGKLHGQLRHGQDRSPQADTSARKKEWLSTLLDSENYGDKFDIAWMGHHHISGRLPWNGPPVIISGSPKPSGEYPRKLGLMVGPNRPEIATAHGVSDDGLTGVYPIDTRAYDP